MRGSGSAVSEQQRTDGDQRCAGRSIPPLEGGKESESPLKSTNMLLESKHLSSSSSHCPFIASGGQYVIQVLVFVC